jgi:hypothetical protein
LSTKRHKRTQRDKPESAMCRISEVATILGVHRRLAGRLANKGIWPSYRLNNRIFVYRAPLMKWLAEQAGKQISV